MEIFHSANDTELFVADILLDLPRMISIFDSRSAIHESTLPKNWACKRKRSSSSETVSDLTVLASMAAWTTSGEETLTSTLLPLSPEPITAIITSPPLPINAENQPSKLGVSIKKLRIRECSAVRKPGTKPLPLADDKTSDLEPSEKNPTKKARREELSEQLSKVSQQRQALARGVEDALRLYERVKAFELQLEEKENELKLCLEREEQASLHPAITIDDHWHVRTLQALQQH